MAQLKVQAQLAIPPLVFSSIPRVPFTIPEGDLSLAALSTFPPGRFRVLNAANIQALAIRADAAVCHVVSSGMRPQASGLVNGTKSASLMNTSRFDVRLYEGDPKMDASIHNSWKITSVRGKDPSSTPMYRIESTSFNSAANHPYAIQVQNSTSQATTRTVSAASTGSKFSYFHLLDAGSETGFYLYNPKSKTFLTQSLLSTGAAQDDVEADGIPEFCSKQKQNANQYIWQFFLDEDVPPAGVYRIIHSSMKSSSDKSTIDSSLAFPTSSPLASSLYNAASVSPHGESQVWDFSCSAVRPLYGNSKDFTITCIQATSSSQRLTLGRGSFDSLRVFRLPSAAGEQWNKYIFYEEKQGAFLSLDPTSGLVFLEKQSLDSFLITALTGSSDPSSGDHTVWKLLPWTQDVADGQYQLVWPKPKDLYISRAKATNLAPILVEGDQYDTSQWWNIRSNVSSDGTILYRVTNYLSGELLEATATGMVLGASDRELGGIAIEPNGQSCLLSSTDEPSMIFGVDGNQRIILQPRDALTRWKFLSGLPGIDSSLGSKDLIEKPKALTLDTWPKPNLGLPTVRADPALAKPQSSLRPLETGIYLITNELTKRKISVADTGLSLQSNDSKLGESKPVEMRSASEATYSSLSDMWYISRVYNLQGLTYLARSYTTGLTLKEDVRTALSVDGRQCIVADHTSLCMNELWRIEPQSNFAFTIASQDGTTSIEDLPYLSTGGVNVMPRATPTLALKPSQRWKITPVSSPITSGIYKIRFQKDGTLFRCYLRNDPKDTSIAVCCSNWRVSIRADSLYTLEPLLAPKLYFLGCDVQSKWYSSERGQEQSAAWKFLPVGHETEGFYLQNAANGAIVTLSGLNAVTIVNGPGELPTTNFIGASLDSGTSDSQAQILTLEESPDEIPTVSNFDSISTSNVPRGIYRISSWRQTCLTLEDSVQVSPPALPKSRRQAAASKLTSKSIPEDYTWRIEPSSNGYYKISQSSGLQLCQALGVVETLMWPYPPVYPSNPSKSWTAAADNRQWTPADVLGAIPDYDAARWKLFHLDGKRFQIVNKVSGDALQIDNTSEMVVAKPDIVVPAAAVWTLEWFANLPDTPDALPSTLSPIIDPVTLERQSQSKGAYIRRELDIESGVFLFEIDTFSSSSYSLTFPEHDVLPKASRPPQMPDQAQPRLEPRDLEPYSLDKGLQYWTVEKDDENWYTITNYLYGYKLAAICQVRDGRRVFPSQAPLIALIKPQVPNTSDKVPMQWRFVQVNGRVSMINRACDLFGVEMDNSSLRFEPISQSDSSWWAMTRISGIPAGLNLAEGVYSLSLGADRSSVGKTITSVALGRLSIPPTQVLTTGASFLTYHASATPKVVPIDPGICPWMKDSLWYLGRDRSNTYTLRSFSGNQSIINNGGSIGYASTEQAAQSPWQLVPYGSKYAIISTSLQGNRLALGVNKQDGAEPQVRLLTMGDIKGQQKASFDYLWDLTREGIFIQGAQQPSQYSMLAATDSGAVIATSFKPFEAFQQLPDSHRSIWHIDFQKDNPEITLTNEHATENMIFDGTHVQCKAGASGNSQISIKPSEDKAGYDMTFVGASMQLSAVDISIDLQGPPIVANPRLLGVASTPGLEFGNLQGMGNVHDMFQLQSVMMKQLTQRLRAKSWNFVPISSVLAGPLITLPKLALAPGELTSLADLDNVKNDVLYYMSWDGSFKTKIAPYKPGLAECRYRLLTYGSVFLAVSEISRRVVSSDTQNTVALSDVKDDKCWLTVANNKVVSLSSQEPKFWQTVMNISDVAERQKPWYIVLGVTETGYPIVLSTQGGNLIAVPFDSFDPNQLWRYYDWGSTVKLRVIIHAATRAALTTELKLLSNIDTDPFLGTHSSQIGKSLGWVVDVDFTLTLQKAGLARHIYLSTSAYVAAGATRKHLDMEQSIVNGVTTYQPVLSNNPAANAMVDMQSRRGCRFLSTPTSFDLSTKAMVIDNIVKANAPVFLHHHLDYLPVDVAGFLPRATLHGPNGETIAPLLDEYLQDPSKRDWSLRWNVSPTLAIPAPVVYVRVMNSQDIMATGFTDVEYSMFYPPILDVHGTLLPSVHGWTKISLRLNNDTAKLDSVLFNGNKRIGNIDTSFSNLFDPQYNPLVFRVTPSGSNRLHIFVSTDTTNSLSESCPLAETPDLPNFDDWKTADGKPGALDASTCYQILQADMIKADDKRSPPRPPPWAKFCGKWASSAANPYGPALASPLKWAPPAHASGLEAARNASAALAAATNAQAKIQQREDAASQTLTLAQQQVQAALRMPIFQRQVVMIRVVPELQAAQAQLALIKQQAAAQATIVEAAKAKEVAAAAAVTLDRTGWTVTADNFQAGYEPTNILNSDSDKIWHTQWDPSNVPLPHNFTIDMKKLYLLDGLTCLPRQDGNGNGSIGQYTIETSTDGSNWLAIASGTWPNDNSLKQVCFTSTYARYVRLTAHSEAQGTGNQWSSCAEFNLLADPDPAKERAAAESQAVVEAAQRAAAQVHLNAVLAARSRGAGDLSQNIREAQEAAKAKAEAQIAPQESAAAKPPSATGNIFQQAAQAQARAAQATALQAQAAAQAKASAAAEAQAQAAQEVVLQAQAAARTRAAAQAEAQAQVVRDTQEKARIAAETQARAQAEVQARAVQEATERERAAVEAQAQAHAQAEAQVRVAQEAAENQRTAQEAQARAQAEVQARAAQEAVERIRQAEAQARATQEAAEKARMAAEAEAQARAAQEVAERASQLRAQEQAQIAAAAKSYIGFIDAATYGPKDVTAIVKGLYTQWIAAHPSNPNTPFTFTVNNDIMQGDPSPGVAKSCSVLFRRADRNNPIETCKAVTRSAGEGQPLICDINSLDEHTADQEAVSRAANLSHGSGNAIAGTVEIAKYGPKDVTTIIQDLYMHGVAEETLVARNAEAAAHIQAMFGHGLAIHAQQAQQRPFSLTVTNQSMKGDPSPGVAKTCQVLFRKYVVGQPVSTTVYVVLQAGEGQSLVFN